MDRSTSLPRLAFVINLSCDGALEPNDNRVRHLAHLFHGHRLPAAWTVVDPERARLLYDPQLGLADNELALTLSLDENLSAKRFLAKLHRQVAVLRGLANTNISLVVGDAAQLRRQASVLAELGIGAILSSASSPSRQATSQPWSPRPLGCGLWQLEPSVTIPLSRRFWNLLPARRYDVKRLMAAGENAGAVLVVVNAEELGRESARGLQAFEKLLREVSWAASHNQLELVRVSEVIAELSDLRRIKPQRSILRTAA